MIFFPHIVFPGGSGLERAASEGGGDEEGLGGGRHHQERLGKGQQQIQ